jgi:RND superfamily putative drug exporter
VRRRITTGGEREGAWLGISAVILLLTLGALVAAGLPLLTAVVGVGLSLFGIMVLSGPLGLSSTTPSLALMLGLAVGIDYALFIVFRYREERAGGREPREAAGIAAGTAGSAVVFAGLTVIIALVALAVTGIPVVTTMGLAAATVAVAVLIGVTLVPAPLGFFPNAVLPRAARRRPERASVEGRSNLGSRWAGFVQRHPLPVLLAAAPTLG